MSVRDIASNIGMQYLGGLLFTGNQTKEIPTNGFDVAHYDSGFLVTIFAPGAMNGNHVITLQESPNGTDWTDIPENKLIKPSGDIDVTAESVALDDLPRIGAFSTERYIRVKATKTNHTADTELTFFAAKKGEVRPVDEVV